MTFHLGTMGFSYTEWDRVFYPPDVRQADYLAYYSKCFDAVELDTTFYAAPDAARVRKWRDATGPGFRFSLKTPRDITHAVDVGKQTSTMLAFLEPLREFGDKLGVVLLQFPPSFDASRWRELEALVRDIPSDIPLAAEFRHASWNAAPGTRPFLENLNVAWVSSDHVGHARDLRVTSNRVYLRLIGLHGRYPEMNREHLDVSADLQYWHTEIAKSSAKDVWILFNNDYAGFAISTAERFKALLGQPPRRPLALHPTLFS